MDNIEHQGQQLGRKAIRLAKKGQYDEACDCHRTCADFYANLLATKDLPLFVRSWSEQRSFHLRQAQILETLRGLTTKEKHLKHRVEVTLSALKSFPAKSTVSVMENEIIRQFEEQDSLLAHLANKVTDKTVEAVTPVQKYTIQPKSDTEIIEELRELNASLKKLVIELMNELEKVQAEKKQLEKKIETFYEACGMPISSNLMDGIPGPGNLPELTPLEPPPSEF